MRTVRLLAIALASLIILAVGVQRHHGGGIVPVAHAQTGCSARTLHGAYGFQTTGSIVGVGPFVSVALLSFDGVHNFTQTGTSNINGSPNPPSPGSGTYMVNPDCTGTQTLNLPGGRALHTSFVITDSGKQIFDVVTDSGLAITSVGRAVGSVDED